MGIKDFNEEQITELSMLEVAFVLLEEQNKPSEYHSLLKHVGDVKGLNDQQLTKRISHLYTEMSIDGRFVNLGDNRWGLRWWYPFDQTEEELSQAASKARKKRALEKEEEHDDEYYEEVDDIDEFEDLEDELDDLANEEDTDFEDLDDDEEVPTGTISDEDKDLDDEDDTL